MMDGWMILNENPKHLNGGVCACGTFYFKSLGINKELVILLCEDFPLDVCSHSDPLTAGAVAYSHRSNSTQRCSMRFKLCASESSSFTLTLPQRESVCQRTLHGCILDFMHLLVMSVAETAKHANLKGVSTYFWPWQSTTYNYYTKYKDLYE